RNLCWIGNRLAKVEQVPVVIADGKLSHPVEEILDRIDDSSLVLQLLPQGIYIISIEIERGSGTRPLESQMSVGESNHDFHIAAVQRGPAFAAAHALEAQQVAVELDGLVHVGNREHRR